MEDGDFDLIISDVQREHGRMFELTGGIEEHDGTNFIVALRKGLLKEVGSSSPIRKIGVLFYGAYDDHRLLKYTLSARKLEPQSDATNNVADLILHAGRQLAESRRYPFYAPSKKTPT